MDKQDTEKFLSVSDVNYFQELMHRAYSDAGDAYLALEGYEGDAKYLIALNYLNMANQSYVELCRLQYERELHHYEIEPFFTAYSHYKFQFKQVINDKDENTSWLFSSHETLQECWKNTNEFLTNWIKTNSK